MNSHFPNTTFVGRALGPEELDYELIQSSENGDLVFGLDQFYDISVHTTFPRRRGRHFVDESKLGYCGKDV